MSIVCRSLSRPAIPTTCRTAGTVSRPFPSENPLADFLRATLPTARRYRSAAAFPRSLRLPQAAKTTPGSSRSRPSMRPAWNTAATKPSCAGIRSIPTGTRRKSATAPEHTSGQADDRLRTAMKTAGPGGPAAGGRGRDALARSCGCARLFRVRFASPSLTQDWGILVNCGAGSGLSY